MFTHKISCLLQFDLFYMSCKRHGDPQWKRNPSKSTKLQNKQISHLFLCLCFHPKIDFCKDHLLLNSTHSTYITSYPTQSSLELLLFQCSPPAMVLHNRLQRHCHLNSSRCNRTSHHDQYRCYVKYMQQEQFYWVFWFAAQLSLVVNASVPCVYQMLFQQQI